MVSAVRKILQDTEKLVQPATGIRKKGNVSGMKPLCLFHVLGLAGGAHRPLAHALEFFSAFFTFVILAFHPVRRYFHINGSSDSTHRTVTSVACIGKNPNKHMHSPPGCGL